MPTNEHGNIEIWEGLAQFIPKGAAFITHHSALKAAKTMEIHHAPVIVGFERRGMHNVPKMGGIVVLKEHEQILLDAIYYIDSVKDELAYEKKDKDTTERWSRLVQSLLSRQRLRDQYGH